MSFPTISTLEELKSYVTAKDGQKRAFDGNVLLTISHSALKQRWGEIKFHLTSTIGAVKERLYLHGGTPPQFQKLQLLYPDGSSVLLDNDARTLGNYNVDSGMEIRIIDCDPHSLASAGWLEDVSKVEKYTMSDEAYDARENTVRKFKLEKLKQVQEQQQQQQQQQQGQLVGEENISPASVGCRCELNPGGKRGKVSYVGTGPEPGLWVGVTLDEPYGKHDGCVNGKRYFTCGMSYGVLVRPSKLLIGDYPERDLEEEDEI